MVEQKHCLNVRDRDKPASGSTATPANISSINGKTPDWRWRKRRVGDRQEDIKTQTLPLKSKLQNKVPKHMKKFNAKKEKP